MPKITGGCLCGRIRQSGEAGLAVATVAIVRRALHRVPCRRRRPQRRIARGRTVGAGDKADAAIGFRGVHRQCENSARWSVAAAAADMAVGAMVAQSSLP